MWRCYLSHQPPTTAHRKPMILMLESSSWEPSVSSSVSFLILLHFTPTIIKRKSVYYTWRYGVVDQWPACVLWWLYLQWPYSDSDGNFVSHSRVHTAEVVPATHLVLDCHSDWRRFSHGRPWSLHYWRPHRLLHYNQVVVDISYTGVQ